MPRVEDIIVMSHDSVYEIPVRIYTPELNKKLPVLLYFHGGGWQRGDIATHDSICRHFAKYSGCIVASVAWRLAPEYKFPVGIGDCFDVYKWILKNGESHNMDLSKIGIGGDSAGGNLTAAIFNKIHSEKIKQPQFQLL